MTKPLTLLAMLLLTVVALGVGYIAISGASTASSNRDADIQACVRRNVDDAAAVRRCIGK